MREESDVECSRHFDPSTTQPPGSAGWLVLRNPHTGRSSHVCSLTACNLESCCRCHQTRKAGRQMATSGKEKAKVSRDWHLHGTLPRQLDRRVTVRRRGVVEWTGTRQVGWVPCCSGLLHCMASFLPRGMSDLTRGDWAIINPGSIAQKHA